jgi:site-specific DNA-methyltransferase (adenine-specific)
VNKLYYGDNLEVMRENIADESVDLCYVDPPFNSQRNYNQIYNNIGTDDKAQSVAFVDTWVWNNRAQDEFDEICRNDKDKFTKQTSDLIIGLHRILGEGDLLSYLVSMTLRINEIYRVLKPTGTFYLHCDPTASHYLKILLDEIFDKNNFVAEIIWYYAWGKRTPKRWNRKHDVIFHYSKTDNFVFNVNDVLDERVLKEASKKRLEYSGAMIMKNAANKADTNFILPADVWYIATINAMAKERTGYPTQKPLALLHRIIKASSNVNDIVLDPFCGCATTCVAAQQLGRKWIGIDIEKQAVNVLVDRLSDDAGLFKDFINTTIIPQRTDIKIELPSASVKERLYREQNGLCNACKTKFALWNLETDHIIPKAKGGGDYYENYQLLCGSCNRIKGNRPMEYLRLKIKTREEMMENKIIFGE